MRRFFLTFIVFGCGVAIANAAEPKPLPFAITVIDSQSKRGVPLIDLTTTSDVVYTTDSAGRVAFDDRDLLGQRVHFLVSGHGYQFKADGFGFRGVAFDTKAGGSATIEVQRTNTAERMCRLTGIGIYRDTELLGIKKPLEIPAIRAKVAGSDSTQSVVYQGKIFTLWGDTLRPEYPLGNYQTTGAWCDLPKKEDRDFEYGLKYQYLEDDKGFVALIANMPGEGPTWLFGLSVLKDSDNRETMWAMYTKIKPPLTTYKRGLCKWDDKKQRFEFIKEIPLDFPIWPDGSHSTLRKDAKGDYLYFCDPYPHVRIAATVDAFTDPKAWESATIDSETGKLTWAKEKAPSSHRDEFQRLQKEKVKAEQCHWTPLDTTTKKPILLHRGTVRWNEYRKKWILIANQEFGTSPYGEVWYAEADEISGPFKEAKKIVTHQKMTFYNPVQHDFLDRDGGKIIYFEGTYTSDFSGNPIKTPRYNYNQILYRLDLSRK